jgi:hypothetical protein
MEWTVEGAAASRLRLTGKLAGLADACFCGVGPVTVMSEGGAGVGDDDEEGEPNLASRLRRIWEGHDQDDFAE